MSTLKQGQNISKETETHLTGARMRRFQLITLVVHRHMFLFEFDVHSLLVLFKIRMSSTLNKKEYE